MKKSQDELSQATGTQQPLKAGSMILHAVSTPLIEVAEDLKTAKGMFYSPGYVTTIEENGVPYARWVMQRYAVDFICEDSWKIWHLFIGVDYVCDVGDRPYQQSPVPAYNQPLPLLEGIGFGAEFISPYDIEVPALYSSALGWCGYPPEPEAYKTLSDTFSYGHEPFLNSGHYACAEAFQTTSEAPGFCQAGLPLPRDVHAFAGVPHYRGCGRREKRPGTLVYAGLPGSQQL